MSKLLTSPVWRSGALRNSVLGMAIATALALPQVAAAMEFDLGNDDLTFRWDNTLRLNIANRVSGQNKDMMANPNYDDGDRNFNTGSIWTRFDVYSEMDLVWKQSWGTLGARMSAAGWWDPGYQSLDNYSVQTSNNLKGGVPVLGLSDYSKRYAEGPSGEFMDWFVFGTFNVGEAPVNVKVGQTTVYWGEGLLIGGALHGISYSQNPIDVWKGLATPGAEAKELFRPRLGFNINSQVTETVNVAAQYFFNWQSFSNQAYRYPESGTFLSVQDAVVWGAKSVIAGPNTLLGLPAGTKAQYCGLVGLSGGATSDCFSQQWTRLWRGKDTTPDENSGNYGLAVRWDPDWADATLGFYYRRTYDMQPQLVVQSQVVTGAPFAGANANAYCYGVLGGVVLQPGACLQDVVAGFQPSPPFPAGTPIFNQNGIDFINYGRVGTYNLAFGSDIDILGLSLSKNIGGLALGAELSYRKNMPLLSDPVAVVPAAARGIPGYTLPAGAIWSDKVPKNDTPGAKGDTMHGVLNLLGVMGESIWDTASWSTELTWMTYLNVNQNEAVFKGRSGYNYIDRVDKNFFGLAFNFTPTWFQVAPGVDMLTPVSWSQGISGNSAITAGGQDGAGSFGLGIALDFNQRYRMDLKYVGFYGNYAKCKNELVGTCLPSNGNAVSVFNGTNAVISDRDFIALTFKTTF
jgi:hypothetical protein